jgi:hypothetical protein
MKRARFTDEQIIRILLGAARSPKAEVATPGARGSETWGRTMSAG